MIGSETSGKTLNRIEPCHTEQRIHSFAFLCAMIHASCFPIGLEVFGKDILLRLPALVVSIVEPALEVRISA